MKLIDYYQVIDILEDAQRELCPVSRLGRQYANNVELYDKLQEMVDKVQKLSVCELSFEEYGID